MIILNSFCFTNPPLTSDPELWFNVAESSSLVFEEAGTKLKSIASQAGNPDELAGDWGGTIDPPTWTSNTMDFDGVRQALVAQGLGGQGTGDFSVAFVVQSLDTSTACIMDKGDTVWKFECISNKLTWTVSDGTDTDTGNTTDIIWDDWNHLVVFTHDKTAGNFRLYIDDTEVTGSPWASGYRGTLAANQGNLTLGCDGSLANFWTGKMFAVLVWQKALNASERTEAFDWADGMWGMGNPGG